MKRILVPIDFSEHSENALEVAATLTKRFDAQLILFHMIGVSESVLSKSELEEQEEAKYYLQLAKKRLSSFLDKPYLKDLNIRTIIQNLRDFSEVEKVAREKQADLIVMGSHGASKLKSFFVGSNTEKVVRSSGVPVLVIKKKHMDFNIKKILLAINLEPESIPAYQKATDLAEKLGAELLLVYVNTLGVLFQSDSQIQKRIDQFNNILEKKVPIEVYNDYTIEEGIYSYAKEIQADLIAVPTHGRQGLAHFFLGSIGENLANMAELPVLTLKI
jgi:nucleotide-binding universal stress UspA family protein